VGHKLKICFRVEAGNIIGTGHLMEIVILIKSLRKRINFFAIAIVNDYALCTEKLQSVVDKIEVVPDEVRGDNELDYMIPLLRKEGVTVFVADILNRSTLYYDRLNKEIDKTFVIFDNDGHREIPATVLVNFNITQSPGFYEKASSFNTEYLIGPKYALLDEDLYYKWSGVFHLREEVKKIFVNQGGSDPFGMTAKILKVLLKLNLKQEIIIVIGGARSLNHKKELEELEPLLKGNYKLYKNISQQMMYELISESDMALTAAGNTLYELAFFGIPSIVIGHHGKHDRVASKFHEQGAAVNLGIGTRINEDEIAQTIKLLLRDKEKRGELSMSARQIVDGYGTGRFADMIETELQTTGCNN